MLRDGRKSNEEGKVFNKEAGSFYSVLSSFFQSTLFAVHVEDT